jgi:hypothetical protein
MSYQSLLLRDIHERDVKPEPYPYLVKRNVIEPDLYDALSREFPHFLDQAHRTNKMNRHSIDFRSPESQAIFRRSTAWREFRDNLLSPRFLVEFMDLFRAEVGRLYPQMTRRHPRLVDHTSAGWRHRWYQLSRSWREHVYIQATFNLSGDGYAVGPHYDNPKKLAAGLFYLRDPRDTQSHGGDFLVIRKRNPASPRVFDRTKDRVDDPELEIAETLPYAANTFCFMFNSPVSLHAATEFRGRGHYRRFVYFDVGTFYRLF